MKEQYHDVGSGTAPVSPDLARTVVADVSEEAMKNVDAASKVVTSITAMSFSRKVLETLPLEENSDDFVFDNDMFAKPCISGFGSER